MCEHSFEEKEVAVAADGYCPLCMADEIARLNEVLDFRDRNAMRMRDRWVRLTKQALEGDDTVELRNMIALCEAPPVEVSLSTGPMTAPQPAKSDNPS